MRPTPPPAYRFHIDRLVVDIPALAPADASRFEQALCAELHDLAQTRPAGLTTGALDPVRDLARHVARSLFETLRENGR